MRAANVGCQCELPTLPVHPLLPKSLLATLINANCQPCRYFPALVGTWATAFLASLVGLSSTGNSVSPKRL